MRIRRRIWMGCRTEPSSELTHRDPVAAVNIMLQPFADRVVVPHDTLSRDGHEDHSRGSPLTAPPGLAVKRVDPPVGQGDSWPGSLLPFRLAPGAEYRAL